jgi:sigma-E factor negative regulatory protein RseA
MNETWIGTDQMSKETREHISSLMDGEISREASRFLVRRLGSDDELCATWARYHVVRDCLRHGDGGFAQEDLCSRVNQVLENDARRDRPRRSVARWLKPVAGMAVAASVALVAVMAVAPGQAPSIESAGGVAETSTLESFTSPQGLSSANVSSRAVSSQRMNPYLLRHYQVTGGSSGRGFVAFVPVLVTSNASAAGEPDEPAVEEDSGDTAKSPDLQ